MDKIKAIGPKIIVNHNVDRPYYSIEYYDTSDNQWHIGYGSYDLENVVGWFDTEFEVVKADVEPVRHGHWITTDNNTFKCSNCNYEFEHEGYIHFFNYCPCCGTKMDGDTK